MLGIKGRRCANPTAKLAPRQYKARGRFGSSDSWAGRLEQPSLGVDVTRTPCFRLSHEDAPALLGSAGSSACLVHAPVVFVGLQTAIAGAAVRSSGPGKRVCHRTASSVRE